MTLAIKTCDVSAVLLADGWHEVEPQSFTVQRLTFTDSDGIEHRKAARKLGYRFLERCRSLGSLHTVVVAGPLKAIVAIKTATEVPEAVENSTVAAPASVPESPLELEARDAEPLVHAPMSMHGTPTPLHPRLAETPVLLQASTPVSPPSLDPDDSEPSRQAPASVSAPLDSFEQSVTDSPAPSLQESPRRLERETQQAMARFHVSPEESSGPVAANVADVAAQRETPTERPERAPEHSKTLAMDASSRRNIPSILLRDEIERTRLARAGHPVPEGLQLNRLGLRDNVIDGDDKVLVG